MDANETGAASPSSNGPIAEAVARIVAAYASRPDTTPDEIVSLTLRLCEVFGAAATAPRPNAPTVLPPRSASDAPVPALPIEQAVTADKVYCLCCGRGFTMLKRHLKAEHGLTEEDYRALYALPEDMPLVAPNYSERKAAYAKRVGLGRYQRDTADDDTPTR
ncbi:MAG: MucR family transcriptional regulator [Pseudodonghicola sp.]|nr:MucR family transcriptional regulator [Pseudodonghicola sp.]